MSTSFPSAPSRIPLTPPVPVEVAAMPDPDYLRVDTDSLPVIRDTKLVTHRRSTPDPHTSRVQQLTQHINDR